MATEREENRMCNNLNLSSESAANFRFQVSRWEGSGTYDLNSYLNYSRVS